MKRYVVCVVLLFASIPLTGCATIINGSTQSVSVSSDPPGARVSADGNYVGVTPIVLELKRKDNHIVTVSMDGYETEQVSVTKSLSGAVAGNILAGGLIGWGVDASSGAQYKLKPDTIALQLRPRASRYGFQPQASYSPPPRAAPASSEDRLRQLERLRRDGVLTQDEYESAKAKVLASMTDGGSAAGRGSVRTTNAGWITGPADD